MPVSIYKTFVVVFVLGMVSCGREKIDFSAQVKPIINKRCISCHGGVKRNGNFNLLFRTTALDTTESGKRAIIPGDAAHSEMIRRLTLTDPEERMPYKEEPLSREEIDILTQWINEGAEWGDHWAYVAPKRSDIPPVARHAGDWALNEIDHFVVDRLAREEIDPSPMADKPTLLRRVSMDLTGLPPSHELAEKFLSDERPNAYEVLVDSLLASPHYGEKWASWWLDLARYADTKGYERDAGRNIWRYRDWVINAFNRDMPFDQFTTEQLAGDLLQNPSDDQLIATAFHRNTMNNDEGGTEDEEFRVAAVIDRVNTTWEVWQSTTMACVQCHTHPYDPFEHDEYYRSMAFFNNTRDEDTEGEHPKLRTYTPEDTKQLQAIAVWVKNLAGDEKQKDVTLFLKTLEPKYHPHDFDDFVNGELIDTKWLGIRHGGRARLKEINLGEKTELIINYSASADAVVEIRLDAPDGEVLTRSTLAKTSGRRAVAIQLKPASGKHDLYFLFFNRAARPEQPVCNIEWIAFREEIFGGTSAAGIRNTFMELINKPVEATPVFIENNADQFRTTHIFERGNWLVKGPAVGPGVPRSLNPLPQDAPANRLGFASWLFSPDNPLTTRTSVNRFWEQLFGYGIVETLEDFGTQGAAPSHPELLDWLALEFMGGMKWSMKRLVRKIVLSAAYRQDSKATPKLYADDPSNRLLARGPRVRLSAEQIRDQALAASGLLSKKMFGKPVMPYQPEGIWNTVYNGEQWRLSEGPDQFRRSVYTYLKRTSPYPALMTFDGSAREVCVSRRIRTNTPLQALVTLNDSTYLAAARALAARMADEGANIQARINHGYRRLMMKDMPETKLLVMERLYQQALKKYSEDPKATKQLLARPDGGAEMAALTIVAGAMFNLDEVITKE